MLVGSGPVNQSELDLKAKPVRMQPVLEENRTSTVGFLNGLEVGHFLQQPTTYLPSL